MNPFPAGRCPSYSCALRQLGPWTRSEEHTSELQSRVDLPFSPTRRSSDLTMARQYLGDEHAFGRTVILGKETCEVVGIVKETYATGLDSIEPLIYEPVSGREMPQLLLRSSSAGAVDKIGRAHV